MIHLFTILTTAPQVKVCFTSDNALAYQDHFLTYVLYWSSLPEKSWHIFYILNAFFHMFYYYNTTFYLLDALQGFCRYGKVYIQHHNNIYLNSLFRCGKWKPWSRTWILIILCIVQPLTYHSCHRNAQTQSCLHWYVAHLYIKAMQGHFISVTHFTTSKLNVFTLKCIQQWTCSSMLQQDLDYYTLNNGQKLL